MSRERWLTHRGPLVAAGIVLLFAGMVLGGLGCSSSSKDLGKKSPASAPAGRSAGGRLGSDWENAEIPQAQSPRNAPPRSTVMPPDAKPEPRPDSLRPTVPLPPGPSGTGAG